MKKAFNKILAFRQHHPNKSAIIILAALVVIFIGPSFFQGRYLAPVDTLHYIAPYLDITTQMLPWWNLSKQILLSGHFPFWNIYSGNGLPLLANMQSAIFFPLTWFFYIFNARMALLLYSFTKLLMMGVFMYWYLRELKLSWNSSLMGAILFAFCGANVIWFLWPLTSVILILPLSFYLIERHFNSKDIKIALWLAPLMALGLFAGHPQTFFYIFCAIYCYTIFKAFTSSGSIKKSISQLALISGIYFLGAVISAVAVLPFLEYLKLSANLGYRAGFSENPFYLEPLMFLANLVPDFYGNTGVKNFSYLLVPNYGEYALGYIGISGLILSLFAFGKKMKKEIIFFAVGAIFVLALIYHAPIIYPLINKLPGFNLNYNNRLLYLWAFFVIVLACFGLEKLLNSQISKKRFNLTWLFSGIFAALIIIANRLVTKSWDFAHNLDWHTVSLWQDVFILVFILNFALAYLIIKKLPKKGALYLLFILVILETAIHGMVFTKTSKPENFYPPTPALSYLQKQFSQNYDRTFTYGDNLLPNIGTWYGINELNDHDTIYLTSNKILKQYVANYNYSPEYTFDQPNLNALRFLSVKYLLYPPEQGQQFLQKYAQDLQLAYKDNSYDILSLNQTFPRAYVITAANVSDLQTKLEALIKNPNAYPIIPVTGFKLEQDGTETFSYNSPTNAYIVTTDNYYPDWTASLPNGTTEKIENAFGLRAAAVPAGEGTIIISYHPKSFELGLEISAGAAIIWLLLYFILKNKKFN
jgi:hypothetical protein